MTPTPTPEPTFLIRPTLKVTCTEERWRGAATEGRSLVPGVFSFASEPGPDGKDGLIRFDTPWLSDASPFVFGSIWTVVAEFSKGEELLRTDRYVCWEVSFNRASLLDMKSPARVTVVLRPQRKPMLRAERSGMIHFP